MDQAKKYSEMMDSFTSAQLGTTDTLTGRRFDRVMIDNTIRYFVDRNTWAIYGAKSSFQYNPRRVYGTLETVSQYDWSTGTPLPGTDAEKLHTERETEIQKNYRPRGRPRKVVASAGAP